jgi:murein tripeptide amidase MpaA
MRRAVFLLLLSLAACGHQTVPKRSDVDLTTTAEKTGWIHTGRYDEAVRLCRDLARVYPASARCDRYGVTPEGRDLLALVVSQDGVLTPEAAARRGRPVILVQAGIHSGEIEGKDAGFVLLRDILDGKVEGAPLTHATMVFVPVVNPDGHERTSPDNRPNQRGPAEMGFRTTAQNLNLNRDYVKADAPEMVALLELFDRWSPAVYVDLHTTDGAKFEHDVAVMVAPVGPRPDGLDRTAKQLSDALQARLTAMGHLPLPFYPSFIEYDDPASGFADGDAPPRFSHAYAATRDRLGILVETHSWHVYKERAQSMRDALIALLERAATDGAAWQKAEDDARAAAARLAGTDVVLMSQANKTSHMIEFRGYAYEKRPSEISGGTWIVYDEKTPQIWKVPLYEELVPAVTVLAPRAGYIVDGGFAPLVAKVLALHGIAYAPIAGEPRVRVDAYRAAKVTYQPPFEGRTRAAIEGAWASEERTLEQGAIFVPMAQPLGRLVLHLLDPALPDSLAQWGHFNAVFERKEYMEAYVAEEAAREMLAKDPSLRAKLEADLAADPELAASPARRLDWFYRRHPAWDERVNLLPVYRAAEVPPGAMLRKSSR